MSARPFDMEQVIARLKEKVQQLHCVEGAAGYATVKNLPDFVTPGAFAILVREQADQSDPKAGRQRAQVTFGVVVAVRNYRDQTGAESKETLDPILDAIRQALIGWQPKEQGARPVKWMAGDVIDYDNNTLLWGDVFQTQHFIGAPS